MSTVTEIAYFKRKESVGGDEFLAIVHELERRFHSGLPGFMSSEIAYNEKDGTWILIQHWESEDYARSSSKEMMIREETALFRQSIDPKTVSIKYLKQLGEFEKS